VIIADTESARRDAELVLDFFSTVLSGDRDISAVRRFLAPDFVDHDPEGDPGRTGVAAKLTALWNARPAAAFRPHQAIAAGGYVAVRSTLEGGERPVPFADTYRVADGRITEHWHVVGA
ncbi:nuclear transport factor 2 family protein, partial [Streptomyces sp. NPDC006992]|uniref:nuclear transport factor 2 family protein n=1 Tax=Streptomyces sp. NPDC006992 TaxID=3155601 RepID=UPI0034105865